MNYKITKNEHSPLDKAVLGILNASLFGFVFSISLFNKHFEQGAYSLSKKFKFVGRNILTLSVTYGLNRFILEYIDSKKYDKDLFHLKLLRSLIGTLIPVYIGYKFYYFRNKNILVPKSTFYFCGIIMFLLELIIENKK